MSGASIIIIGGGGSPRATMQAATQYTLLAGEGVQNVATSGSPVHVIFRIGGASYDWWLAAGPGSIQSSFFDGTVELA